MRCSIGVDIGHTNIRAARVADGVPTEVRKERTDVPGGPESVLEQARRLIAELSGGDRLPVGVGIAGQCDSAQGVLRCGPGFWWPDMPFRDRLSAAVGAPVVLRNDVVMATVGEWKHGAGRGVDDLVCLFVGTGVGGGAVVGGRLLEGASGCGGHFGHVSVQMDGPVCSCGRRGCVEVYAGGSNVEKRARLALDGSVLKEMSGGRPGSITCSMVAEAAERGDESSLRIRDEMAAALSSGVASIINSLNPARVVLGGSVMFGFPELHSMVARGALEQCLRPAADKLTIERSALGDLAGTVGAATMALEFYG